MTLSQADKNVFSRKMSRIITDAAEANTYTIDGKYAQGQGNLEKVIANAKTLSSYLDAHTQT